MCQIGEGGRFADSLSTLVANQILRQPEYAQRRKFGGRGQEFDVVIPQFIGGQVQFLQPPYHQPFYKLVDTFAVDIASFQFKFFEADHLLRFRKRLDGPIADFIPSHIQVFQLVEVRRFYKFGNRRVRQLVIGHDQHFEIFQCQCRGARQFQYSLIGDVIDAQMELFQTGKIFRFKQGF